MKYATDAQVWEAILRWRGNVTAAADALGIQPKNLRKRLDSLRVDLLALRRRKGAMGATLPTPLDPAGHAGSPRPAGGSVSPATGTGRESGGGLSTMRTSMPILRDVSTPVVAVDERDAPIKGVQVKPKPLRLRPELQDRLRDAKLDLGARYRIETDENAILDQFFEEAFGPWLRSKMAPPAPPKRKAKAEKGDTE